MRDIIQETSSTEFPTGNPNLSFGKSQNELLKTIYIGIIEGVSDTLSSSESLVLMTEGLKRLQSMLFSVSQPSFMLSDENIQKKLGLFYAYCQKQIQLGLDTEDCRHLAELPEHFTQLLNTIELCPIKCAPQFH